MNYHRPISGSIRDAVPAELRPQRKIMACSLGKDRWSCSFRNFANADA